MNIYDSRYFNINKALLTYIGLWPYGNQKMNQIIRVYSFIMIIIMILPAIFGIRLSFGIDLTRFLENLGVLLYILIISLKIFTTAFAEKKFKSLYNDIILNWEAITEKNEKNTLIQYSERGRMLTIGYITYMTTAFILYVSLPVTPVILNKLKPLNESRPYIFIFNGEFLVDRNKHYSKIYLFDALTSLTTVIVFMAVDTMYVVCTEHCLGLFAIVKYRLQVPNKLIMAENSTDLKQKDEAYSWMVDTIKLHNKILKFTDTMETTYSPSFLIIVSANCVYFALLSLLSFLLGKFILCRIGSNEPILITSQAEVSYDKLMQQIVFRTSRGRLINRMFVRWTHYSQKKN